MKDIAIKDPKTTVSQDSDCHPGKKTRLSTTSKSALGSQPSKLIAKRSRLLKYHPKKVTKATKHDISSASGNPNLTSMIESNTKMIQTEFCSSLKGSSQEQNLSYPPASSSPKVDENFKLNLQRPQFDHLMPQIREHLLSQERHYIPNMPLESDDLFQHNRSKLCSWIFEVCSRFHLRLETGFYAVNIIDRIAGLRKLRIDDFPLLGSTSLFMAAKYEEIKVPCLEDFVHLISSKYRISKQAILRLESALLIILDFKLSYSSPLTFLSDQAEQMNLPKAALEQAQMLAQKLTIESNARYWCPSFFASYCIQTVINAKV